MDIFETSEFLPCVHFGPITRSVQDASIYLDATVGYHTKDPASIPHPGISYFQVLQQPLQNRSKIRIGYSFDLGYVSAVHPQVIEHTKQAITVFKRMGFTVEQVDIRLPDMGMAWLLGMNAQGASMYAKAVTEDEKKSSAN